MNWKQQTIQSKLNNRYHDFIMKHIINKYESVNLLHPYNCKHEFYVAIEYNELITSKVYSIDALLDPSEIAERKRLMLKLKLKAKLAGFEWIPSISNYIIMKGKTSKECEQRIQEIRELEKLED